MVKSFVGGGERIADAGNGESAAIVESNSKPRCGRPMTPAGRCGIAAAKERLQQAALGHGEIQLALGQPGVHGVARAQLGRPHHGLALGVGQQGVAALQHQLRIEQLQPQRGALQAFAALHQAAPHDMWQIGLNQELMRGKLC